MIVLALDLAARTGWAVGPPAHLPAFGSFRLDHPRDGGKFMILARRVSEMIADHGVTDLVLEAPHVGGGTATALPLFGYRAAALMAAEAKKLPAPRMVAPATWRKAILGHGRLKRAAAKAATIERMRDLGHHPKNEDEADALALWHYRCTDLSAEHLAMTFRRGAFRGSIGEGPHAKDHDQRPLAGAGSPPDRT